MGKRRKALIEGAKHYAFLALISFMGEIFFFWVMLMWIQDGDYVRGDVRRCIDSILVIGLFIFGFAMAYCISEAVNLLKRAYKKSRRIRQ